ncbi:MAG: hypothetical protein K6T92_04245, partial [Candidatus Rokubacteria bacterium]|nr:hypothetical protein [Candidatus Rokubacteria bacterium]
MTQLHRRVENAADDDGGHLRTESSGRHPAGPSCHFWLDWVALRPHSTLITAEGDRWIFARAIFDVRDPEALAAALAGHPDLARDAEGAYVWTEEGPEFRRGLGRFVVQGDRLVLETQSQQRVERGRRFLESLVGDAVRFRVVEYEDVGRALARTASPPAAESRGASRRGPATGDPKAVAPVPPEVAAEIVGAFYERQD